MSAKRKHGAIFNNAENRNVVAKPAVGTKTFNSGSAVREGLASGSRQAIIAFHQQILTPYSSLPLSITHPTITIVQHYQQASPTFDEIFNAWREGDRGKNDKLLESAASLLAHLIQLLTPMPFFRTAILGIAKKLVGSTEPYPELLNRLLLSGRRDLILAGAQIAGAIVQLDPPDASKGPGHSTSGRLANRIWAIIVEGGSARVIAKLLGMRRRNKEGAAEYGSKDPLDRPDIRHSTLHLIIPLLSLPSFHSHLKPILPAIYSNLTLDPAITIHRLLNGLWAAITGPSAGVARRNALALLDENALENMLGLLSREEEEPNSGKTVSALAMAFLEGVTTVPGQGICFPDEGWYPRRAGEQGEANEEAGPSGIGHWKDGKMRKGLHNRILSNVVRKIGARVIDDQGRVGDWVIKVLHACPELVESYWPHSALSLDPKLNSRWLATVSYIGRIISLPPPQLSTFYEPTPRGSDLTSMPPRSHPPSVNNMIESIFPAPLSKIHLTKGLQHADHLVQHVTALSLARGLQKLELVWGIFRKVEAELELEPGTSESVWAKRRMELEIECRRRVPDVLVIIAFAQKSATLARIPADSDEEPDPTLVAQSAMLTEVALRLFGLYHRTLPSIAREAKFDVGKLLVSSSSAKEERREKRAGREGSVISDTGSVGSIGTIGTVGMGGGFGQSRGDVDGFEALSQVHVLTLLSEVRGFDWINKASGSQYSYLYHILILHLSTPHPITKQMTSNLLDRLLLPSILFDHDHGELEVWLSALPQLSSASSLEERALLVAQQIHLLSFLDDCVRRCIKTPYRYIEDGLNLLPEYFQPTIRPHELLSPLLMAILEQLNAKLLGQHIATEAAGVIIAYLHRVLLGLSGKLRNAQFLEGINGRLSKTVLDAREKGQERKGLMGSIAPISADIGQIFGGHKAMGADEEPAVKMIDEGKWQLSSPEKALLSNEVEYTKLQSFVMGASPAAIERYGRFLLHLISTSPTTRATLLALLCECLIRSQGSHATRLRQSVFEAASIKSLLLAERTEGTWHETDAVVTTLRQDDEGDVALAEVYVHDLLQAVVADKKGKNLDKSLSIIRPWTRFFSSDGPKQVLDIVVKNKKRVSDLSPRAKETLSALLIRTNDSSYALAHLEHFIPLGLLDAFTALLQSSATFQGRMDDSPASEISKGTVKQLIDLDTDESYALLYALVTISPSAVEAVSKALQGQPSLWKQARLLPVFAVVWDIHPADSPDQREAVLQVAFDAVKAGSLVDNAIAVICVIATADPDRLSVEVDRLALSLYGPNFAKLARALIGLRVLELEAAVRKLVHLGLQALTRAFSSGTSLTEDHLAILSNLVATIKVKELDLDANLVEPVITAVVQDRLTVAEATSFAALLVEKTILKASFIRQHLSLLYSSSTYATLASPVTASSPIRTGFVHLLSALFATNPYVSCQPDFLEQLLPLYRGTLGVSDQRILSLFHLFEGYRHVSVMSVLTAWSAGAGNSKRAFDALTSLEPGKVFATCIAFPLKRVVRDTTKSISCSAGEGDGEGLYDPALVIPLFAVTVREKVTGLDWVEILRTNVLGLAVCCLSSRDQEMRALGSYVLARTMDALEHVGFHERVQLQYILRLIRHAIPPPVNEGEMDGEKSGSSRQPRLPVLTTVFLAHVLRTLASPSNPLYADSSRFLLQRSVFDPEDVPMLFGMLYASGEGYKRDRAWIVRLIRDASRTEADWRLLKRRKTVGLFQTLYQSAVDLPFRKLLLQALESITRLPPACLSITHRSAFLPWLNMQWIASTTHPTRSAAEERDSYLALAENISIVLVSRAVTKVKAEPKADGPKGKGRDRSGDWVYDMERLLERACDDADLERLVVISRIALRLTSVPNGDSAARLLPPILDRLCTLRTDVQLVKGDRTYGSVIENLFRCSLTLPYAGEGRLRERVEEVGRRVSAVESEIGEWMRRERRRVLWEAYKGDD